MTNNLRLFALPLFAMMFMLGRTNAQNSDYITTGTVTINGNTALGFVYAKSGKIFTPWGNDGPSIFDSPKKLTEELKYLKSIGTNVIRIFPQFDEIMTGPTTTNAANLLLLKNLINQADAIGMRVDITGLGVFSCVGPAWYDRMSESQRWSTQTLYWAAVADTAMASKDNGNAIFCYDLENEPMTYTTGESWYHDEFNQYLTKAPGKRTNPEIAVQWIRAIVPTIKRHDTKHPVLITVGTISSSLGFAGFIPSATAPYLDFITTHIYPDDRKGDKAVSLALEDTNNSDVGKAILVEETFNLSCGIRTESQYLLRSNIANGGKAAGWIGHGSTIEIPGYIALLKMGSRAITAVSNTSPIVMTTATANPLVTGQTVYVTGVRGNTAANSPASNNDTVNPTQSPVTVIDSTHFQLNGFVGNGQYTGGGTVSLAFLQYYIDGFFAAWLELFNNVQDLSFEDQALVDPPGGFVYNPVGYPWSYSPQSGHNGSGICENKSVLTSGNPTAPDGCQVAFIQGTGEISQEFYFQHGRRYAISFKAAQRHNIAQSPQRLSIRVDSNQVGAVTPDGPKYKIYKSPAFDIGGKPSGFYNVAIQGLATTDSTAFLDCVQVTPVRKS